MPLAMLDPLNIGSKIITFERSSDGQVTASCPCRRLQSEIQVRLTREEARELLSPDRRMIEKVLPNHSPALREIFLSGITPAEWDAKIRRRMRSGEEYLMMGYTKIPSNVLKPKPHKAELARRKPGIKIG
jgi:hypothetical protein